VPSYPYYITATLSYATTIDVITLNNVLSTTIPLNAQITYYLLLTVVTGATVDFKNGGGTLINTATTNINNYFKAASVYANIVVYYNGLLFSSSMTPS
jgi:hypothetical protein